MSISILAKSVNIVCTDCNKSMKETITRYVCWDNHMSVKKSDVVLDENGNWIILKEPKKTKNNIKTNSHKHGALYYIGIVLITSSGLMGLAMNNQEFYDSDEFFDYLENDARRLNNYRYGLLALGGLFILLD